MNLLTSISTNIGEIGNLLSKAGAFISSRTDLVGRVAKVGIPVIEVAESVVEGVPCGPGVKVALENLKNRLKTVKDVTGATNVFERGKEWADPVAAGILKSWQKTTSRACLTVGQALETVNFVDKLAFGFFTDTSFSLGQVPILGTVGGTLFPLALVKDVLICASSAMGIWDASNNISKASEDVEYFHAKKVKWNGIQAGDISIEKLKEKYSKAQDDEKLTGNKNAKWNNYLKILEGNEVDLISNFSQLIKQKEQEIKSLESDILDATIRLKYTKKQEKIAELNMRISTAQSNIQTVKFALEKEKINEFKLKQFIQFTKAIEDGHADMVIRYKKVKSEIRETNKEAEIKKSWISIAAEVAKIVIITLAVICMAIGISKLFVAAICLSVIGFISESLGVTRTLYMEFAPKPKKEPGTFSYA